MDHDAVERLTGAAVTGTRPVAGGYTHAVRCLATLADGRTVFVKQAVDEMTRGWLRAEQAAYATIAGSFMPAVVAAGEDTLILEDLSGGHWPPPWSEADLRAARDALEELHALPPPPGLPHPEDQEDLRGGWRTVAEDPEPFLSLGLVEPAWLAANLDALRHAGEGARVEGDSIVHMDIRSDNMCVTDGRCRFVDWNWVCRGNPDLDDAFWLPSLHLEGGPEPSGHPELAAMFAGFLACRAGLPEPARGVRAIQRAQLEVVLPWAARELGLSRPRPR